MTPIDEIAAERRRQIQEEGWTTDHDDQHIRGEMATVAALYAMPPRHSVNLLEYIFPASWDRYAWWKPKTRRRDLIRAGALIVAEIERMDRRAKRAEARDAGV